MGIPSNWVYRSLKRNRNLDNELLGIEKQLLLLVKQDQQSQLTLLQSISGIGMKTALFLIVVTDGFKKFETGSQLYSYVGITPTIRESGSSVGGEVELVKLVTESYETFCFYVLLRPVNITKGVGELYERIVNKGKSKKLALSSFK